MPVVRVPAKALGVVTRVTAWAICMTHRVERTSAAGSTASCRTDCAGADRGRWGVECGAPIQTIVGSGAHSGVLNPLDFIARLVALVPALGLDRSRYRGRWLREQHHSAGNARASRLSDP